MNEQSAVTFVSEVDSLTPKVLVFELVLLATVRHLRPDEGDILRNRRYWSLRLRFWAAIRHLRSTEGDILRIEGHGLCACAS